MKAITSILLTICAHSFACTDISSCKDRCECAIESAHSADLSCRNVDGFLNYATLHYCTFGGLPFLSIFLMVVWTVFLIYMLVSTTEQFFCPAFGKIAERYRLSGTVTGVTLLAVGNSGPDVFASFAAVRTGSPSLAFGAVLGGGLFVVTIVFGLVALFSPPVAVARRPFIRDVLCLLAALLAVAVITWDSAVYVWEAIGLIVVYAGYVAFVVLTRYFYQRAKKRRRELLGIIEDSEELFEPGTDIDADADEARLFPAPAAAGSSIEPQPQQQQRYAPLAPAAVDEVSIIANVRLWGVDNKRRPRGELAFRIKQDTSCSALVGWLAHRLNVMTSWPERSLRGKLLFVLTAPSVLVRSLTTMPVMAAVGAGADDSGDWSRLLVVLNGFCIPLFVLAATKSHAAATIPGSAVPVAVVVFLVAVALAVALLLTTNDERPPRYVTALVFVSFAMSSVWLFLLATELVSVVRAFGRIAQLSEGVLGVTVVAWADSIVDLIANTLVARQGFPEMAVAACFAAPLLNIMLGLGVASVWADAWQFPAPYAVVLDALHAVVFVCLGIALLVTVVVVPLCKFSLPPRFGYALMALYVVFLVFAVLVEARLLF